MNAHFLSQTKLAAAPHPEIFETFDASWRQSLEINRSLAKLCTS